MATTVEFGPVRVAEDLGMRPEDVSALGFKLLTHWSNVPAVSEADAYAITCRQRMLAGRVAARREAEMAEFAARYPVPAGVPTDPTMSGLEQMVMACEERPRSVREQLLDEALAAGRGA